MLYALAYVGGLLTMYLIRRFVFDGVLALHYEFGYSDAVKDILDKGMYRDKLGRIVPLRTGGDTNE